MIQKFLENYFTNNFRVDKIGHFYLEQTRENIPQMILMK